MIDVILTLTFSIVMLFFMIYPAMKITEWLDGKFGIPEKYYKVVMLVITVMLSLGIGLFLKFA